MDQFKEALDDTEIKIVQFLNDHPTQAFEPGDIHQAPGHAYIQPAQGQAIDWGASLINSVDTISLLSTLDGLVRKRKIARKAIGSTRYYAARR